MTKEFLTKLGIPEENISQILAENKKDCDGISAKFGDYEDVKTQLSAANKQIEDFGKLDVDGLKNSVEDYKKKLEAAQKESAAKLEKMQFDHILEGKLAEKKPKNATAVKALLNMDGLKLSNGEILGLTLSENPFIVLFDRPSNKGNLGTMIRSCDALGADMLIITGHSIDLYDPDVVVSAMGSFFNMPVIRIADNTTVLSILTAQNAFYQSIWAMTYKN